MPPRLLNPAEKLDWLRLIRSENVGPVTFYQLLQRFGSAAAALDALPEPAERAGGHRPLLVCSRAAAERETAAVERVGARLVAWGEPAYPAALAATDDAPPLLPLRGNAALLARPAIAVRWRAERLGEWSAFRARPGAAIGRARPRRRLRSRPRHRGRGASRSAPHRQAVVAGGVDVVYPAERPRDRRAAEDRDKLAPS